MDCFILLQSLFFQSYLIWKFNVKVNSLGFTLSAHCQFCVSLGMLWGLKCVHSLRVTFWRKWQKSNIMIPNSSFCSFSGFTCFSLCNFFSVLENMSNSQHNITTALSSEMMTMRKISQREGKRMILKQSSHDKTYWHA